MDVFCFVFLVCSFLPLLLPSLVTQAWDACDRQKNVGSDVTHANYSCGCQAKMATRKQLHSSHSFDAECCEGGRELFEACRNGDVTKVRRIVNINPNVNIRDTAGRKSSPLHFAAGKNRMKTNRMAVARWCQLHFFSKEKEYSPCWEITRCVFTSKLSILLQLLGLRLCCSGNSWNVKSNHANQQLHWFHKKLAALCCNLTYFSRLAPIVGAYGLIYWVIVAHSSRKKERYSILKRD